MVSSRSMLAALVLISFSSLVQADSESAYREENTDYTVYENKVFGEEKIFQLLSRGSSAHSRARPYDQAKLPATTKWKEDLLQERFEKVRDEKVVKDHKGVLKKASWFYPDDGCFARAAIANRNAFHQFYPVPGKVFAFGNLRVKTANSPRGAVGWWYHVAPIVEVAGKKFVLDPAIEMGRPMELLEWLTAMGNPQKIKVSICNSGTYMPSDNCDNETDGLELRGMQTEKYYLKLEEDRLRQLGRTEVLAGN